MKVSGVTSAAAARGRRNVLKMAGSYEQSTVREPVLGVA
jgi:hypothetical protein